MCRWVVPSQELASCTVSFVLLCRRVVLTPAQHWSMRTPWTRKASLWGGFAVLGEKRCAMFVALFLERWGVVASCGQTEHWQMRSEQWLLDALWQAHVARRHIRGALLITCQLPYALPCPPRPCRRFWFAGDTGMAPVFKNIGERLGPFDLAAIPVGACEPWWIFRGSPAVINVESSSPPLHAHLPLSSPSPPRPRLDVRQCRRAALVHEAAAHRPRRGCSGVQQHRRA